MRGVYLVWRLWSACLILGVLVATQSESSIRRSGLSTTSSSAPICPSASINYITHTLAQQCLKTGYTAPTDRSNGTSTATPGRPDTSAPGDHIRSSNTTSIPVSLSASTITNDTDTIPLKPTSSESLPSTTVEVLTTTTLEPILKTVQADNENDSALDTAKFLSFEDWKNQNLAQAGQSAEHLGARANAAPGSERRRPENSNGLESFGEEAEIEIDFGFGGSPSTKVAVSTAEHGPDASAAPSGGKVSSPLVSSRDAGRTCKERFNYASFDCAANIIKTNARSKSANSILVENKDSYMLNECSISNKFLIVELCDDILVDTVVLANFEFFSSMFRTFKISVSDRYPVKAEKWKDLGIFEAKNSRSIQAFLVENPLIWARYLRVEFLSHYGSEYYCPVSLIRIHGTTMMEEFRHQEQLARGELDDEDEEEVEEVEVMTRETLPVQVVVPTAIHSEKPLSNSDQASTTIEIASSSQPAALLTFTASVSGIVTTEQATISMNSLTSDRTVEPDDLVEPEIVTVTEKTTTTLYYKTTRSTESATSSLRSNTTSSEATASAKSATTSSQASENAANSTSSNTVSQPATVANVSSTTQLSSSLSSTASSTIPVASAPPATQESFFKSIHKRLGSLESNATLSLQYIESQSALLRDAFASASKRQLAKTTTFLETLNSTISIELLKFRGEYDQLWQSTVLELAAQREEGRREREVLAEHVRLLAEEVVSQKRIVAVQAGLMLVCLGAVLLGQFGMGAIFGATAFSPTHSKRGSINGLGRQQDYTNLSRANSPADPGNESGGSVSALGSAGKPSRHWRQRWRWDSPFRSGGASSAVSSAAKPRKPLPFERRVRSENDRTLLDVRMQAMSVQEDDDDDDPPAQDGFSISPNSPETASVVDGTDGVSDVDVDGGDADVRDRSISASRGSSAGSDIQSTETIMEEEEADSRTPINDTGVSHSENDRFPFGLLSVDDNHGKDLMQTRSAPTTPMA